MRPSLKPAKAVSHRPYGWHEEFKFGIHEGKTVQEVFKKDPAYLAWLISEGTVRFTAAVAKAIDEATKDLPRVERIRKYPSPYQDTGWIGDK